jgi:uncharacterized protein YkwD
MLARYTRHQPMNLRLCGVFSLAWAVLASCEPQFPPAPAATAPGAASSASEPPAVHDDLPATEPTYTTTPAQSGATGQTAGFIERVLLRVLREQRGEVPSGDPRLAAVARWAAARGVRADFSSDQIEHAARRVGHVGPGPSLFLMRGTYSREAEVEPFVRQALEGFPSNLPLTRYAIAESTLGSAPVVAIALASLEVALDPVQKRMSHQHALHLAGSLASRFDRTHLAVTLPGGEVRSFDHDGRRFVADLHFDKPGTYQVELEGEGQSGPVVVANFPVYIDVDEPAPTALAAVTRASDSTLTAARLEERLLVLLNDARHEAHVPALRSDDDLAAVARGHSRDMAEHGFFGHVSPTQGTTDDRVRRAQLKGLAGWGENVVLAKTPEEAHNSLMGSPGHRDNMLRPEFTHVGIAAAIEPGDQGPTRFAVTYLFVRRLR